MSMKVNKNGKGYSLGFMPEHYPADRVYLDGDTTKTVQDAINKGSVTVSVPTGQTWTWQTLLNDLFSKIDLSKINGNSTLWEINPYWSMCHHLERKNNSNVFFSRVLNTSDLSGATFQLNSSASKKYDFNISSGNTFTDNSSSNVSSGTSLTLYY